MKLPRLSILALLPLLATSLLAKISCPPVFGDHMVLQREKPVAVWGKADAGEQVTVSFAGQSLSTTASPIGEWKVQLASMPASAEPRKLSIQGTNTLEFSDVLVGEVWLCSGQSNMEKPVGPRPKQSPTDNWEKDLAAANHPQLRLFQVPRTGGKGQKDVLLNTWVTCSPESLKATTFSAAGYYFGAEVLRHLNVPVGLIHSSYGGTRIEYWIAPEAWESYPALADFGKAAASNGKWENVSVSQHYRNMIVPVRPFTLRGFLWYQGESNAMNVESWIYTVKMHALIEGWRKAWGDDAAPFYFVHIAPYRYANRDSGKILTEYALPLLWDAQQKVLNEIPNTGLIPTSDITSNLNDIHPTNKHDVGLRLARLALARTYGINLGQVESPRFGSLEIKGNTMEISLQNADQGLETSDNQAPALFLIAGIDRNFVPAQARIEGNKVLVSSTEVPAPVAVRFGWTETAQPNLRAKNGLPALPFRTDKWPVAGELVRAEPEPVAKK